MRWFPLLLAAASAAVAQSTPAFDGQQALKFTAALVAFGPRPAGSPALAKARAYIKQSLAQSGWSVEEHRVDALGPKGRFPLVNLVACRNKTAGNQILIVSGHYDTKNLPRFVGANDGGSSAGLLLELARVLPPGPSRIATCLVWFDAEEAVLDWSASDSLYGSRALAAQWDSDGTLRRIKALINVDMIGDKDLALAREYQSAPWLTDVIWAASRELNLQQHFLPTTRSIEDDHLPFLQRGVPAVDLIDFDYGPQNRFWHTDADTLDKLSPQSLETIGRVLQLSLRKLQR